MCIVYINNENRVLYGNENGIWKIAMMKYFHVTIILLQLILWKHDSIAKICRFNSMVTLV